MTILTKTLLGTAAIIALTSPVGFAQDYDKGPVTIDQVQLGSVWSNLDVHVETATGDIVANNVAASNTASAIVDNGPLSADVSQKTNGNTDAYTHVWSGEVGGHVIASTSATGNTATVANWYGNTDALVEQHIDGDVSAKSSVDTYSAKSVAAHATAAANVTAIESDGPDAGGFINQGANSNVDANSFVFVNDTAEEFVQNVTIAAGNSADVFATDAKVDFSAVQETDTYTNITSTAEADIGSAPTVINAANAAGNQFNVSAVNSNAIIGAPDSETFQGNGADVAAVSNTHVGFSDGLVSGSANGVGNSIAFSGIDSTVYANTLQNNIGNVSSDVAVDIRDLSGGTGFANATAIGNSFSAIADGGAATGSVTQQNFGNVAANSKIRAAGTPGSVIGTATAIGNSATFHTGGYNNGRD